MAHINRKEYWMVFGALFFLTILGGSRVHGRAEDAALLALTGPAIVKPRSSALLHAPQARNEDPAPKRPSDVASGFYALILIAEGAWRRLPW
jgi:hypothetical protein